MTPTRLSKQDLSKLTSRQAHFYRNAVKGFREKMDWGDFEQFVFGRQSPLFDGVERRQDVLDTPFYQALRDMWLQLGIDQGMVRDEEPRRATRRS